jgi:hypothetical protein
VCEGIRYCSETIEGKGKEKDEEHMEELSCFHEAFSERKK